MHRGRVRELLLVGSIPWFSLVVVYEIRRVAEFRNCSCRNATARWSITYAFVWIRGLLDAPVRPQAYGWNHSDTASHHHSVVFRRASRAGRALRPGADARAAGASKP